MCSGCFCSTKDFEVERCTHVGGPHDKIDVREVLLARRSATSSRKRRWQTTNASTQQPETTLESVIHRHKATEMKTSVISTITADDITAFEIVSPADELRMKLRLHC